MGLRKKVINFIAQGGEKREAAKVYNIGEDTIYRWLRRAKAGDLKPKKRTKFPRKVSDKTLGAYVREHPDRTLREISQAVGLAVSNVHRHLKNGVDLKKTTLYAERCPQKRAQFQEELAQLNPDTVAFLDEAGVDNRLFRVHARAP